MVLDPATRTISIKNESGPSASSPGVFIGLRPGDSITLAGTALRNEPHIVKVNDYWLDVVPTVPYLLFVDNPDQPGSIGAVGTVLTAGYMLWMLQKVNFGEPSEEWAGHDLPDVDRWEMAAWVPLLASILAIGVFPRLVFGATNDAVVDMMSRVFGG